jgi:hypothetical protein
MSARRTLALLLGLFGLLAALVTGVTSAQALPPSAAATQIRVDSVSTPAYGTVPQTLTTPYAVVTTGVDFSVAASFLDAAGNPAPLASKTTNVRITAVTSAGSVLVADKAVPGGSTSFTFTGLRINSASTGLTLHLETTQLKTLVTGDSGSFPVNKAVTTAPGNSALSSVGAGGGDGLGCFPTATQTTCAELRLPTPGGTTTTVLLSLELCDAIFSCPTNHDVVGAYVGLNGLYDRTHPASLVYKCDKTACAGGGVSSYSLNVQVVANGPVVTAPPCPSKGVIGTGQQFCVDYRASKRDNASDLNLVLLFFEDPRVTIPAG